MQKPIRQVTYGPNPITTALPYKDVREALAVAERAGYAKAAKKSKIPERLVRMYCAQSGIEVARYRDKSFISFYPSTGKSGTWAFSREAARLLQVEVDDRLKIEVVSAGCFRLGGKSHYRAVVRKQSSGPGFTCPNLARKMMVDGAEAAVRFQLSAAARGYLAKRI